MGANASSLKIGFAAFHLQPLANILPQWYPSYTPMWPSAHLVVVFL